MNVSESTQNAINAVGGLNIYGHPNFRLIWSEDRFQIDYGQTHKKYGEGKNRWVLEKWCPAEMYGDPEKWARVTDPNTGELVLGPFPSQGDYEHSYTFSEDIGSEIPESLVVLICQLIERGKANTRSERWAAIRAAHEKKEADDQQRQNDIIDERLNTPSIKNPSERDLNAVNFSKTTKDLPKVLPQSGFSQLPSGDLSTN